MGKLDFFTEWERLKVEKKFLVGAVIVQAIVILVLVLALKSAYQDQRIIVLPPKVDQEFWGSGNTFSSTYLEQVAFFLSDRLLTVSPKTVKSSFDTIIGFVEPSAVRQLRESLNTQAEAIIRERVFQVFYPEKFTVDTTKRTMIVSGMLKRFSGNVYQYEAESIIRFTFNVREGRLYITSIEVIK
jgi:conjugal transfer pilus assembly protein TraE